MVKVRFFTLLRLYLKRGDVDIEIDEVTDLLSVLKMSEQKIGRSFLFKLVDERENLRRGTIVLVNGKNILHLQGLNTRIERDDQIALFPPGGGG